MSRRQRSGVRGQKSEVRPLTAALRSPPAALLIVLAGLVFFANSFQGGFVFDDFPAIRDNPTIRQLWPLTGVLLPTEQINTVDGRPLLNLSFALNYAAGGLNPWGYHAVNLAIHLLAGLTLFGIVRRTLLLPAHRPQLGNAAWGLALVVALVWVVHPLQTESVTYLCQRAESLVGLLYLLTVYFAIRSFDSERSRPWQAAAVATCLLGVTAKEVMATVPVLILLYDRMFVAGTFRRALQARWGFYVALLASWAALAALMVANAGLSLSLMHNLLSQWTGQGETPLAGTSRHWLDYTQSQFGAVVRYLRLTVWPDPLILDYGYEVAKGFRGVVVPAVIVSLLLLATAVAFWRCRWAAYAALWFFLILAPTTSIVPVWGQTLAEHRMYLPLAGVVALLVIGSYLGWQRLLSRWLPAGRWREVAGWAVPAAVAFVAVATLGVMTVNRNRDYRSEFTILQDTVRKRPTNPRAQYSLGNELAARGRLEEAAAHYLEAIRLTPDYVPPRVNLANLLLDRGKTAEAIAYLQEALQWEPDHPLALNNLAWLRATHRDAQFRNGAEAVQLAERAREIAKREDENNLDTLAAAYAEAGRFPEAVETCRRAVEFAEAAGKKDFAAEIRRRLELYEAQQPYRE